MKSQVKNVLRVLDKAGEAEINEGRVAYTNYRAVLTGIGEFYGYPLPLVIAVFAALSPNCDYYNNLRSAATVINAHKLAIPRDRVKVASYNHCRDRAFTYLDGVGFLDTVKGKKIRSFYQNILNPLDPYPVTIDGHALNIWRGERRGLKDSLIKPKMYDEIADDYREVSQRIGLIPNQTQAITWLTWKWLHNLVVTKRQLHLFQDRSNDIWKTLYEPEDIKPYNLLP